MNKNIFISFIGLLLVLTFNSIIVSAVEIDSCQTLSSPGTYTLNQTITSPLGTCIAITSSDIIFDCDGYEIQYDSVGFSIPSTGIDISFASNVTIQNCIVRDVSRTSNPYSINIKLDQVSSSSLINNTAYVNATTLVTPLSGIYLTDSDNNNLVGNIFTNSEADRYVILLHLVNSSNNVIHDNEITGDNSQFSDLIYLVDDSNNNNITSNILTTNSGYFSSGINIDNSDYSLLDSNVINLTGSSANYLIKLDQSNFGTITNNSGTVDSYGNGDTIMQFVDSDNNGIANNNFNNIGGGNSGYGAYLVRSNYNNFTNDIFSIIKSGTSAKGLTLSAQSDHNTFTGMNLTFTSPTSHAIYIRGSDYNTFTDIRLNRTNTSSYDWYSIPNGTNSDFNSVSNLNIVNFGMVVSFKERHIFLKAIDDPGLGNPSYWHSPLSKYLLTYKTDATPSWIDINISYTDSELTSADIINESTLGLYAYPGSWSKWLYQINRGVDSTNNLIYTNITGNNYQLTFGIFGERNNTAPTISSIELTPEIAYPYSTLSCGVISSDAHGDPITTTYEWYKNGISTGITTQTYSNPIEGDTYNCTVTVNDTRLSSSATSDPITISGVSSGDWDAEEPIEEIPEEETQEVDPWSLMGLILIQDDLETTTINPLFLFLLLIIIARMIYK